jgi:uncharacterized membrane protein (DUF4010 family)
MQDWLKTFHGTNQAFPATVAELVSTLSGSDLADLTVPVVLLTSVSMFFRNFVILAFFAPRAIRTAAPPIVAMSLVAAYWVYRDRHRAADSEKEVTIDLGSPVSLKKVSSFAILFLALQIIATLGQRWIGNAGFQIVSILGGLFSSASTTAAAANLVMRGHVSQSQAGIAVVLTSIASAVINLPLVQRQAKLQSQMRELIFSSGLQVTIGIAILCFQSRIVRLF